MSKIKVAEAANLNVEQMTFSAMQRFVAAVDQVMQADDICAEERRDLIGFWAYQYARPDMPKQLKAAIARCQASEFVHPTASSVVDWISGEVVPFGGSSS